MDATSDTAYVSVFTAVTLASTLTSSNTHIDWGFKIYTFLLSIRQYSWEISPLCFNSLVQIVLVVCCAGLLLACLFSGALAIFLGFELGSLLDFTLILFRFSLKGLDNLCLLRLILVLSESDQIFLIGDVEISVWSVWRSLVSFCRHSDGLIIDILKYWSISTVSCTNTF